MNKAEKKLIDIDKLASAISQDIADLSKKASSMRLTGDLEELDLKPLVPAKTTEILKAVLGRLIQEGEKIKEDHKIQVEDQAAALEEAIAGRQEALKQKLSELKKEEDEIGDSASVIGKRMGKEAKRFEHYVSELRLDRKVRSASAEVSKPVAEAAETPKKPAKKVIRKKPRKPTP